MNTKPLRGFRFIVVFVAALLLGIGALAAAISSAGAEGENGTTLSAEVSATGTRTWDWDISKSVDRPAIDMFTGDAATVNYTVAVVKNGFSDVISGEVCVTNGGAVATDNLAITLRLSIPGGGPDGTTILDGVVVLAAGGDVLAPGGTGCYPYSVTVSGLTEGVSVKVTGNVTITNHSGHLGELFGPSPSATTSVAFVKVNESINVDDSNGGSWLFGGNGSVSYTKTFNCDVDEGSHGNTATIRETGEYATASVTVNCYELAVTKDASTSLTRTWEWTISKSANQTSLTLALGQTFDVTYTVTIPAPTSSDSDWAVSGNISVYNPAPIAATLNGVADVLSDDTSATVTCGVSFPYTLAAGGTLNCTYEAALAGNSSLINTATATLQNSPSGTTNFTGTANVNFDDAAVTNFDDCINVSDSYAGELGQMCVGSAPQTFTYVRTVGPYQTCGSYTVDNTATFTTTESGTTGSASATVSVNVPCGGCTLTLGYWKTHSDRGPAPYDDAWKALGPLEEDTLFFNTGKTWYEIFQTPPAGNQFYNLAHQYMAAKLNILNGAASTPEVDAAILAAENYFGGLDPNIVPTGKLSKSLVAAASLLDKYNNGLIGPGHCSEQMPA